MGQDARFHLSCQQDDQAPPPIDYICCEGGGGEHSSGNLVRFTLNKDKHGKYILLDVRQPEEYEAGHIPGAIFIRAA